MTGRRAARHAATALIVGAGVVFVGLAIQRNWSQIGDHDWRLHRAQLAGSVLLLTVSLGWSVFVWKRVLDRFDAPGVTFPRLLRISFLSKMARYIPGKVWQLVAVGQLSQGMRTSPVVMITSMLVHAGIVLLSAVFASALLIAEQVDVLAASPVRSVALLALLSLAAAHPRVINLCLKGIAAVARQETLRWNGRWTDSIEVFFFSLLSWLADGVAFYLFVDALLPVEPYHLILFIGIHAFSFVAGYVAFVAPAGAGVREATMATLLRGALPTGAAAVIAVLARLWTIAAEVLGTAVVLALRLK
jgi:glycosyltransferase 2 family protein